MSPPRALLLAVDGLDWGLVHAFVDAGRMPAFASLIEAGASGRLAVPPPHNAAAIWTTVATGMWADRHGVCGDLAVCTDGLDVAQVGLEQLGVPALWHWVAQSGQGSSVAGWPAVLPQRPGAVVTRPLQATSRFVAAGFDIATGATAQIWPLAPHAVWPRSELDAVADFRVHPDDVPADAAAALLAAVPEAARAALQDPVRVFIAACSSVQALGTSWAAEPDDRLIALRLAALPGWARCLGTVLGSRLPEGLLPTYQWLDLLVGRYLHMFGRDALIAVVSDRGLVPVGYGASAEAPLGGVAIAGPGVPTDHLWIDAGAADICPTLLALMGLTADTAASAFDGRNLLGGEARSAAEPYRPRAAHVAQNEEALAWLAQHGLPPADLTAMGSRAHALQAEWELARIEALALRGDLHAVVVALADFVAQHSGHALARFRLGEALLVTGRVAECAELLQATPASMLHGVWREVAAASVAQAEGEDAAAHEGWLALVDRAPPTVNPACRLGWLCARQRQWASARDWFLRALQWPAEQAGAYEGLALAQLELGETAQAARALARACALGAPARGRLQALWACVHEAQGDLDAGRAAWERAYALDPAWPEAAAGLARAMVTRRMTS